MIENDRWCISVYFSRTWRLKSQDIDFFKVFRSDLESVVFGEGVAPCRQCTSMLLVIPPLGFVFPENCEVPEVGTHNKNSTIETCVFFFQTENHIIPDAHPTNLQRFSSCETCLKKLLFFFWRGFLRLKAVRSNQSQLCWELWCFIVFFWSKSSKTKKLRPASFECKGVTLGVGLSVSWT